LKKVPEKERGEVPGVDEGSLQKKVRAIKPIATLGGQDLGFGSGSKICRKKNRSERVHNITPYPKRLTIAGRKRQPVTDPSLKVHILPLLKKKHAEDIKGSGGTLRQPVGGEASRKGAPATAVSPGGAFP